MNLAYSVSLPVREEPAVDGGSIAPGEFVGCVLLKVDDHLMGGPGKAHHEEHGETTAEDKVWEVARVWYKTSRLSSGGTPLHTVT